MIKLADVKGDESSARLTVRIERQDSLDSHILVEAAFLAEGGITKNWGSGYSYRLDRRPEHHGGDQLHVYGPKGNTWAYRYNGSRSEPTKYNSPATSLVRDMVRDIFKLGPNVVIESYVLSATARELVVVAKLP